MNKGFSAEAKVGVFVLMGLMLLAYMSLQVGNHILSSNNGYLVKAHFGDVSGLVKGAAVKIAGVDVGTVETIALGNGFAIVTARIQPAVKIPRNSIVSIKTQGVMGEKYFDVRVGEQYDDCIKDGEEIVNVENTAGLETIIKNINTIAEDISGITSSLNKALAGEESARDIKGIVRSMASLTNRLDLLIARNEGKIDETIEGLREASSEMKKTFAALNDITEDIQNGEGMLGKIVKDQEIANKLDKTITSLTNVAAKLNENKSPLGKLINDEEMGRNLEKTVAGLNRYVEKTERLRTSINYRGEFLTDTSKLKSHLNVKIEPQADYFYQLGVTMDPRGRRTLKDTYVNGSLSRVEEWDKSGLLFNAMLGKRFHDVVLRGGVMESSGGMGVDYFAFDDDLKLSFEAFDFSDDRKAHLKAQAEYKLFKGFYLSAGYDDFISTEGNRSPFVGFSLYFDDDDLKTVLGSVPLMK